MMIPIIMHIHLGVILGMVIFPLVVLRFPLGLICPKTKGKTPNLAILDQNCLQLTASGKLFWFSHFAEVMKSFSLWSHVSVCTLWGQMPHLILGIFSQKLTEKGSFWDFPQKREKFRHWGNARGKSDLIFWYIPGVHENFSLWCHGSSTTLDSNPFSPPKPWIMGVPNDY